MDVFVFSTWMTAMVANVEEGIRNMKGIKFSIGDQGVAVGELVEIQNELEQVNGRASSFTITSADTVVSVAKRAESYMSEHHVPASDRGGATVIYRPKGPSANNYRFAAASTQVTLRRKSGSKSVWYLDNVKRVEVYPRNPEKFGVTISDAATRSLVKRVLAAFGRTEVPADEPAAKAA